MCFNGVYEFFAGCGNCIRRALLCCYDWLTSSRRVFENWEVGTYSSTSNLSIRSEDTVGLEVREVPHHSDPCSSPPSTPSSPDAQLSLEHLSTVDEERSSQISTASSLQALETTADEIVKICQTSLLEDKTSDKPKRKSGDSVSSPGSKKSKEPSPSPRKSKKPKNKDHVHVDIEDEQVSFTVVKEKRSPKHKSPGKPGPTTSASPDKDSPKRSPKKIQTPSSESPKPKYTNKQSRSVDSSISYAQVASNSSPPKEEITTDKEAVLLALKEPEPPRPTLRQIKQDSSESNSDYPVVFETTGIVHRDNSTESEADQVVEVERSAPQEEERSNIVVVEETQNLDDFSPIESSERDNSAEDSPGGDDEYSESVEEPPKPQTTDIIHIDLPEPKTESITISSGDCKPGPSALAAPTVSPHPSVPSVDSSTHQTLTVNTDRILNEIPHTQLYKLKREEATFNTIADVRSDILDREESAYAGDQESGRNTDLEEPHVPEEEPTVPEEEPPLPEEQPPVEVVENVQSPENGIFIIIDPCSSLSPSSNSEEQGRLGYGIEEVSDGSLKNAARQRKISSSTEEHNRSEIKELPVEEPTEATSEDLSPDTPEEAKELGEENKPESTETRVPEEKVTSSNLSPDTPEEAKESDEEDKPESIEQTETRVPEESTVDEEEVASPDIPEEAKELVEGNKPKSTDQTETKEPEEVTSPESTKSSVVEEKQEGPSEKKKKNRKNRKKKKQSQLNQTLDQSGSRESTGDISLSEVIEEEPKFIQEDPEVDNQDSNNLIDIEDLTSRRMPVRVERDLDNTPAPNVDNLGVEGEPNMVNSDGMGQIRVLTLNDQDFREDVLYRLERDWTLEFRMGPTLFGRKIEVYCNFPGEKNGKLMEFERTRYQKLKWRQDGGSDTSDDTALYAQISCKISGSFHYYFVDSSAKEQPICGSGYFLVDPVLTFGENERLPLDCIQCQTVITKHLGSFTTWESKLKVSKESGYNMVHFTPIQELGDSNSAYCLNDQLKMNPAYKKENGDVPTFDELKKLVQKMKKEWKVISICDVVLNHTANGSPWILEHPEASYNCHDCKYMRPAYLLDAALGLFQEDVKNGLYETRGIPSVIDTEDHLNAMRYHLMESVFKELKLHELFICDVNSYVSKFMEMARHHQPDKAAEENDQLKLIQDPDYRRLASTVDMDLALKIYNIYRPDCFDEDSRLRRSCEEFKRKLDALNQSVIDKIQDHLNAAVNNIISGVRHWRVSSEGPKLKEITIQDPLVDRYFTDYGEPKSMKEYEEILYSDKSRFLMAHNGWIMGQSDCLVNFAGPDSDVYLRRELISWGDNVKLRYGEKPSDSPFLWEMMRKYVELTASIFDGVRLDNCHSTPLKVAEYLMDCARKVRPDIYVVAELFTGSVQKDNIFVNRLGITSLIREAMSAPTSYDLGGFVHRFGGIPVGSFYQPNVCPLVSSIAHALLFDLTHDNESPVDLRSVFNFLPNAALVNMACCGTGSNRGYDELVPHKIDVVKETRDYTEWSSEKVDGNPKFTSIGCGIIKAKKALNDLHFKLGSEGFDQVYVDQMDPDVVAVTRHCPKTHQRYILVAFTAFSHPNGDFQRSIRPLRVEGELDEIVLEATLSHEESCNGGSKYAYPKNYQKSDRYINGYSEYVLHMKQNIQLKESEIFEQVSSGNSNEIALHFKNFKPGSIVIIKVSLPKAAAEAVVQVRKLTEQFSYAQDTELKRIIANLELRDLNKILYKCDPEEREDKGLGDKNESATYFIPNSGALVYAGLQGFISLLSKVRLSANPLGHPMCENIRQGDWMIDYIYKRLMLDEGTADLGAWIERNTRSLKAIPKYLKPAYFDLIFTGIYVLLLEHSYNSMSSFVKDGSMFVKALSMGSIQFAGYSKSADLPKLSPNLTPPKPLTRIDEEGKETQVCASVSAGLPRFSVGCMRNWGRDTFIALRGLLLLTGRYQEARYHILAYASCLRHGLIPNLLDGGRKARYNCRDAVWWWLYCIRCYVEEAPGGAALLEDKVSRIFPSDDSRPMQPGEMDQSLQDVMQEALNRHFQGVAFRERNAGREIDEQMTDNGFNNQIGVHPETGFVFGGNVDNCGTWMDKMGSSGKAGNKGRPATPRDGSACEIVGLSKCVVSWLAEKHDKGLYKYSGVERTHPNGKITKWSFKSWADKIQSNFEKCFWVSENVDSEGEESNLINRRGIYKDCYGATQRYSDYQLRCNFPIVMVVAPELFNPQHAWTALQQVEKILLGPLGMKTLDPSDWAYRGDYDNSNDSADPTVAQGFNYHQGPEWVWPIGFFLRAKLHFASKNGKLKEAIAETKCTLSRHFTELQTSDWRGLPELTNSNGSKCVFSSETQAWSMSCVLEVLYDLRKMESSVQ